MTWAGVRDRLADLSAADPDFTRFGAGKHRYRLEPPVPAAEIADFEARHGVTLPEEYRGFLLSVGGHGAGPYYGLYRLSAPECPDEDGWRPGFLSTPFPFTEAWNRAEHHPTDNEIPDDRASDGGVSPGGTGFREWYLKWLDGREP